MGWTPNTTLAKAVDLAGFEYDPGQDIIQSTMNAWQRHFGYWWLYDVAAQPLFMIIDCEPFYFDYDDKRWMIELWKGQYGIMTGAEIGLYNSSNSAWNSAANASSSVAKGVVSGVAAAVNDRMPDHMRFFHCATNPERLRMQFKLSGANGPLFTRGPERHWWLTGFRWGEFTQNNSSLVMEVQIEGFPTPKMRNSFADSVIAKGYIPAPVGTCGIKFTFGIPKTPQPATKVVAPVALAYNQWLVKIYKACTKALGFKNNDPNNFKHEEATNAVKLAVEKARATMPAEVDPVTAYHIILDLFEKAKDAWRGKK